MKISADALRAKLEREISAGSVASDAAALASHSVDGKTATAVCFPSTPEEVCAILSISAENDATVVPWGGGTSMALGNIPRGVDVVIGLEKLARLIEHDDANLTATAQAGMRVTDFQKALAERRQFLPIDPPHPSRATVGGIVAANSNGPRRLSYGGVRDLVIGMKMILAGGEKIKAGGKVVKNVAGYDLCKLFVGSLGTLGIITEVTFRVAPLPEGEASFVASGALDRCARFSAELSCSPLLPAAVTIAGAGAIVGRDSRTPAVIVWLEGFDAAIERHARDLKNMAESAGLAGEVLRDRAHKNIWDEIRDFGWDDGGVLYRLNVPIASVADALAEIDRLNEAGKPTRYVAHAATGTVWLRGDDAEPLAKQKFPRLAALAHQRKGHAVVAAAPAALKIGIDVWGEAPASLHLMRRIKREFDPKDVLSPGRLVGGL